MKDLLILGTGVHAAEMAEIVERTNLSNPQWNLLGYADYKGKKAGEQLNGYPVYAWEEIQHQFLEVCYVPDNDWPKNLDIPRERFVSLIDPSCFVSKSARIGVGCVLYPNCFVGLNAQIGDFVFCLGGSIINHDDVIEDQVILASGVSLAGSVHVEAGCYLGQASTCRQYLRIGAGSLIGMGAVVVKDVPPNSIMTGNPARRLRERVLDIYI